MQDPPMELPEGQPETPEEKSPGTTPQSKERSQSRPDPTRYGDWELRGRCIDF